MPCGCTKAASSNHSCVRQTNVGSKGLGFSYDYRTTPTNTGSVLLCWPKCWAAVEPSGSAPLCCREATQNEQQDISV